KRANAGNEKFVEIMQTFETGHAAYNAWYSGALGVDAGTNQTEAHNAAHLLAGPMPEAPIPYRSIEGQRVLVTPSEFVLKGNEAVKEAHVTVMAEAAGGEIAMLNPAAVRRAPTNVEGNDQ
ncbi:MAG: hypothetical protein OIF48_16185, partial [Silicimonas sp.]|nr:hypothetical protein [Silicimonas sp.]